MPHLQTAKRLYVWFFEKGSFAAELFSAAHKLNNEHAAVLTVLSAETESDSEPACYMTINNILREKKMFSNEKY